MSEIVQIVIVRPKEPLENGFKIIIFNRKEVVKAWTVFDIDDALGEVKSQMETLVPA